MTATTTTAYRPATAGFLDAMAALAGGVCVVTAAAADGTPAGFTSTAVMSLSRAPQLIAIGVQRGSRTLPLLQDGGRLALNILAADGESVSRRFADPAVDRFAGLEWTTGEEVCRCCSRTASSLLCAAYGKRWRPGTTCC